MLYVGIFIFIIGIVCIGFSAAHYKKVSKIISHLDSMLNDVMSGSFSEKEFNETKVSKLESKLADFLSKSNLSVNNIKAEQDKIKSLIADISHQTKTPISNIKLYSELLNEQNLPQQSKDLINQITFQSEKLDFLIRSLVKTSRLENGIIAVLPKLQDITPMLEEAVEAVSLKADKKNITVKLEHFEADKAYFDKKWTVEAIYNILDNAVKYTADNGWVNIKVISYEMFVRIDISDNGIGISENEQSKIFMRFYRSSDVSEQEGIGIGLYLTRSILASENGFVKVSSNKNLGSTFSVFLKK